MGGEKSSVQGHHLGANKQTLLLLLPQGPAAKAMLALFPSSPAPPMKQTIEPTREKTDTYRWVDAKEQ